MNFGEKIRELRKGKNLTLRELAVKVKVNFTYLSKIENQKLSFGEFPSEDLIRKLAKVLQGDVDELLILAEKMPEEIKKRVMERPDAFRKIAKLDDEALDKLLEELDEDHEQSTHKIAEERGHRWRLGSGSGIRLLLGPA